MVFFDGMLGGVLDPGGDARFNALAAVPDGFAREAFLVALRVATVFVSWMLSPILLAGVADLAWFKWRSKEGWTLANLGNATVANVGSQSVW